MHIVSVQKEVDMEDVKMDVKMICAYTKLNCEQLAIKCNIDVNHLKAVMAGRARMLATDLENLHVGTGIPYQNIKID